MNQQPLFLENLFHNQTLSWKDAEKPCRPSLSQLSSLCSTSSHFLAMLLSSRPDHSQGSIQRQQCSPFSVSLQQQDIHSFLDFPTSFNLSTCAGIQVNWLVTQPLVFQLSPFRPLLPQLFPPLNKVQIHMQYLVCVCV